MLTEAASADSGRTTAKMIHKIRRSMVDIILYVLVGAVVGGITVALVGRRSRKR